MPFWGGGRRAWAVVAVSSFLLLSMGGAIVAAPVTVPLLYLVVRAGGVGGRLRVAAVAVAALTVAEVAWAATYLVADEARPWIWLAPMIAGVAAAAALTRSDRLAPA